MSDPTLPPVFSRAEAMARGFTRAQADHRAATGRWRQLRRGIYCLPTTYERADPDAQHRLEVEAAVLMRPDDVLVSHLSAACLLGWPRPLEGWGPATLTAATGGCARQRRGLLTQAAGVRPRDRWEHRGLPITAPARTLADVLRHQDAPEAVAMGDAALRSGTLEYDAVAEVLAWQSEWPYAARGTKALQLLDPRRETWLESYCFVDLHLGGLPMPEPQVDVFDRQGRFIARLDALWDGMTAGEADGRVKYDLLGVLGAKADPEASVEELVQRAQGRLDDEKWRHDELADVGLGVVRWHLADVLHRRAELIARIERRRAGADPGRFTGRLRLRPPPPWLTAPAWAP